MPRSTNPSNYEEVYWDLLSGMEQEIPEIKLQLATDTAQKVKFTFYAFIRALEVHSDHMRKQGNMAAAGELTSQANAMRKYLVDIQANGSASILRFINRDLNPMTASMREQVKEQLEMLTIPTIHRHIEVKPVASFFDKPLEVKDDDGDTGTS